MKQLLLTFFYFLTISFSTWAQLERANKYYENKQYQEAVDDYRKVLNKDPNNTQALEKIADCFRLMRDYDQAEPYYRKLTNQTAFVPENYLLFGLVLWGNNNPDEAQIQFGKYLNAVPHDRKAPLYIKACDDLSSLKAKPKQADVSSVALVNTDVAEISPVYYKNKLVFVSDRIPTLAIEKYNYWHVYEIDLKAATTNSAAKAFPYPVNTDAHDGPASFNSKEDVMALTHVELLSKKEKGFVNRTKLFFLKNENGKWSKPIPFQYNSNDYSVAHAVFSFDDSKLYFASDMPGGFGGMDIYVCEKQGEGWGPPKNLGDRINTGGDEVFPYLRKDGTLFLASDGHSGYGGLDVFSATPKGEDGFNKPSNMGADINTFADDFGIVFAYDNVSGYFSSDRAGGKGRDDIYSFTLIDNDITIAGTIVKGQNKEQIMKAQDLLLLAEDGKELKKARTNKSGFFKFENLEPGKKYHVKLVDVPDAKSKYYLISEKNKFIRETGINGVGGKNVFRDLPADLDEEIELEGDGVTLAGNLLVGKGTTKPLANTKVNLLDEKGNIVKSVITNEFGSFVFSNLSPDHNYLVKVDEEDVDLPVKTKVILTNKSGKEIQTTTAETGGSFTFKFLESDKTTLKQMEVQDADLRIDFKGKFLGDNKKPIANSVVNLVNEKGEVLQSTKTDEFGAFKFENLPADQHVLLMVDEKDPQLKGLKRVVLTNNKGAVVKEISSTEKTYKFSLLPSEQNKLGTVYVDDPWLNVLRFKKNNVTAKQDLTIVENVYYGYGEFKLNPEAMKILDKVINLMEKDPGMTVEISSHTDSRSSQEYNLKLSQQRATEAVNYIVKNGIDRKRISGNGYGESKLINKCADGVDCSEDEHAKNRRTEFLISHKNK